MVSIVLCTNELFIAVARGAGIKTFCYIVNLVGYNVIIFARLALHRAVRLSSKILSMV